MLDELRKPFLIIALVLILLVVLVEGTSVLWLNASSATESLGAKTPGYGISYLAFLDILVFYITLLIALAMIIPERLQGRVQGCVTAVVSFLGCLGTIFAIITCLIVLILRCLSASCSPTLFAEQGVGADYSYFVTGQPHYQFSAQLRAGDPGQHNRRNWRHHCGDPGSHLGHCSPGLCDYFNHQGRSLIEYAT